MRKILFAVALCAVAWTSWGFDNPRFSEYLKERIWDLESAMLRVEVALMEEGTWVSAPDAAHGLLVDAAGKMSISVTMEMVLRRARTYVDELIYNAAAVSRVDPLTSRQFAMPWGVVDYTGHSASTLQAWKDFMRLWDDFTSACSDKDALWNEKGEKSAYFLFEAPLVGGGGR